MSTHCRQSSPVELLPNNWRLMRLRDFGYAYSGLSGKRKEDFGTGSFYVPYKNIFTNAFVDTKNLEKVALARDEVQNKVGFGDILFTISSEIREQICMSAVMDKELSFDLYLNSFCFGFRPTETYLLPKFSGYAFRSDYFRRKVVFLAQGSTRYNISKRKVLDIALPIPTVPEQQKIATILKAVDDKLNVISRQIEATQALKQGLIQSLFSRGVGTQDAGGKWVPHKELKKVLSLVIPVSWNVMRLGDIAPLIRRPVEILPDATYPELGLRSYGKGTFRKPALLGSDVGNKRLFEIKAGDLLFSNVFAWEGAVAIAKPEDDGRYGSHRYITCAVDKSLADTSYIYRYLITPTGIASLSLASPGGAGRNKTLGLSALSNITIPLPPLAEQQKISKIIDVVEAKIQMLEAKQCAVETIKRGLMQKLLTGEWLVRLDSPVDVA
ncbi:hypothetical protein ALP12_200179 [Pseudomonas savastanoi pv. phaseolicola]|uniref:restriction endonuclease subunit S n=1 Tax=Pseudomonas savastanoi TaxID=29438 RepID=UPI0006B9ABDF|nr:restriction endonuclease subunit S [Pseudomonas savastanoi]KPB42607.1 Restriction modification system DNA specificity domain protein [Pseudomonas savastanoi pv. phaseolicola]RMV32790.1 hypothetical protein ALP12_200179 [Pseudomonas savastanoi pv. phaseolicola]